MTKILFVLLGGAFGTGVRYFLSSIIYSRIQEPTFPYANLVINVSGSFLIGALAELFDARMLVSPATRVALLTGVLGGYTTFSSFAFETVSLLRDGELWLATLNLKARQMGIAGATMLRGMMGFGAASRIHTAKILRLSEDLPIVVEIVDSAEKIGALLPVIEEMVQEGLITLEKVRVLQYRSSKNSRSS